MHQTLIALGLLAGCAVTPREAVERAVRLRVPVYLAGPAPAGMRPVAPLRASARGARAHLDTLLAELDRRAIALHAEAVVVRAIRLGGEATVMQIPRPCAFDAPTAVLPSNGCSEPLTGVDLEMTVEAEAMRSTTDGGARWTTPAPLPDDAGAPDAR